jgi:hypothetical protein
VPVILKLKYNPSFVKSGIMTELSVTKTEKASKARNPQTLPEN